MAKIEKSLMLVIYEYQPYIFSGVVAEDLWCIKIAPHNGYHKRRIRRAQHLLQHFLKTPAGRSPPTCGPSSSPRSTSTSPTPGYSQPPPQPSLRSLEDGGHQVELGGGPRPVWLDARAAAPAASRARAGVWHLWNRELIWEKQGK